MFSNYLLLFFMAFFSYSSHKQIVKGVNDFDLNVCAATEDSSDENEDISNQSSKAGTSNDAIYSQTPQIPTGAGSSSGKRKNYKHLKFRCYIEPIDPNIDSEMEGRLRFWEHKMLAKYNTSVFVWENRNELDGEKADLLCVNVWQYLKPYLTFREIIFTDNMTPACDSRFYPAPTHISGCKSTYYYGFFQYLDQLENKTYYPDMLRCNCAYVQPNTRGQLKTVNYSKKFFFLHKLTNQTYGVLTMYGTANRKQAKIVYVYNQGTE